MQEVPFMFYASVRYCLCFFCVIAGIICAGGNVEVGHSQCGVMLRPDTGRAEQFVSVTSSKHQV